MLDRNDLSVCFAALLPEHAGSSPQTIEAAVEAASAAGFRGLSLFAAHAAYAVEPTPVPPTHETAARIAELRRAHRHANDLLREGRLEPFAERLRQAGLAVHVLEFMTDWTQGPEAAEEEARAFCPVAQRLGATHVLAVCVARAVDLETAVLGLRRAAEVAAGYGLRVCLEFAPIFAIGTFRAARETIEAAGGQNIDFAIDTFHWAHDPDGQDLDGLAQIPGDRIALVQVSSAQRDTGDLEAAQFTRAMPHADDTVLRDLLGTLDRIGATPVIAPEVFNPRLLAELGQTAFAQRLADATRSVL